MQLPHRCSTSETAPGRPLRPAASQRVCPVQCSRTCLQQPSRFTTTTDSGLLVVGSYLSWDDYFIALAFLSAQRSKDPNKQVGMMCMCRWHY